MPRRSMSEILSMKGDLFACQGFSDDIVEEWVRNASSEEIVSAKRQCDRMGINHIKKIIEKEEEAIRQRRIADNADFLARTSANVSKNTEVIATPTPWWRSRDLGLIVLGAIIGAVLQAAISFGIDSLRRPREAVPPSNTATGAHP